MAHANGVLTFQIGPDDVMAALSVEFDDRLTAPEIEAGERRIEAAIKLAHPEITTLFVRPETNESWCNRYMTLAGVNPQQQGGTQPPQTRQQ